MNATDHAIGAPPRSPSRKVHKLRAEGRPCQQIWHAGIEKARMVAEAIRARRAAQAWHARQHMRKAAFDSIRRIRTTVTLPLWPLYGEDLLNGSSHRLAQGKATQRAALNATGTQRWSAKAQDEDASKQETSSCLQSTLTGVRSMIGGVA